MLLSPLALSILISILALAAPQSQTGTMTGGGEVALDRDGEYLRIVVKGPRSGMASLCAGDESRVRILHASAAVGEATYVPDGGKWRLKSGFDWKLRDGRDGGPAEADVRAFVESAGWVANASRTGNPERTFRIKVTPQIKYVGVTFLSTDAPMSVSTWPASMKDGCAALPVIQGYLPETVDFHPETWHRRAQ